MPEPFSTTADEFVPSDWVLPQLRTGGDQFEHDVEEGEKAPGLDSGFLTITGDIMNMSPYPTSLKYGQFELTPLAVKLIGGVGFAQEYTFTPTAIDVSMATGGARSSPARLATPWCSISRRIGTRTST